MALSKSNKSSPHHLWFECHNDVFNLYGDRVLVAFNGVSWLVACDSNDFPFGLSFPLLLSSTNRLCGNGVDSSGILFHSHSK
mmetsp:Transcript_44040/g.61906  ORF Transcript_44040/g.61906 Transcript_44040/m.61906 type:complete len:82 (-) Transcript_44040:312-557(-)